MDFEPVSVLIPLLVALVTGGAVAFYTAKPQKDSIIALASKNAVEVVNSAISRLEDENEGLRARIEACEKDNKDVTLRLEYALEHVNYLVKAVNDLGGSVDAKGLLTTYPSHKKQSGDDHVS